MDLRVYANSIVCCKISKLVKALQVNFDIYLELFEKQLYLLFRYIYSESEVGKSVCEEQLVTVRDNFSV